MRRSTRGECNYFNDEGRDAKVHGTSGASPTALGVHPGDLVELTVQACFDRDYAPEAEDEVALGAGGALPTAQQITTGGKAKGLVEGAVREIVFWKNGFQLGPGGALRRYDDPVQAAFLADINKGCVDAIQRGWDISVVLNVRSILWYLLLGKRLQSWACHPGSLSNCGFRIARAKISCRTARSPMHCHR